MNRLLSALSLLVAAPLAAPLTAQDLLVTSWNTNEVLRYDGTTGAPLGAFVSAGSGGLRQPHSATFAPDGSLLVTSFSNDRVLRYDGTTGAFLGAFIPAGTGGLDGPTSAEFGANGNLFVTSFFTPGVLEFDGTTGAFVGTFIGPGNGLASAETGHFGRGGDYYLANGAGNDVLRYDGATGAFLGIFARGQGLNDPHDAVFGPNGDLFVSSFGTNKVNQYDGTTGAFVRTFLPSGNGMISPHGMLFPGDGFVYVAAFGRDKVLRFDATTGAFDRNFVGRGSGGLSGPISILRVPEPALVTPYGCGVNSTGSLSVLAGTPRIGTCLTFGIDNPVGGQAPGSSAVLCLSLAPDPAFPCGTTLAGFGQGGPASAGELLLDLHQPAYLFQRVGPAWQGPGSPSAVVVSLPLDVRLVGTRFYAQGVLVDLSGASPNPGLTDALELRIGL